MTFFQLAESFAEWASYGIVLLTIITHEGILGLQISATHGTFWLLLVVASCKLGFSKIAGRIVDRSSWKKCMIYPASLRAVAMLLLATFLYIDPEVPVVVVAVVLISFFATQSVSGLFIDGARAAAAQVEIPENLRPELSAFSMFMLTGVAIIANFLAALMVEGLYLETSMACLSLVSLLGLTAISREYSTPRLGRVQAHSGGMGWIQDTLKTIRLGAGLPQVLLMTLVFGLALGMIEYCLPLYGLQTLNMSLRAYALFTSLFAVGNILGTVFAPYLVHRVGDVKTLHYSGVGLGLCYVGFFLSTGQVLSMVIMFINGVLLTFFSVSQGPILQRSVPVGKMGSVTAIMQPVRSVAMLFGVLLSYAVAEGIYSTAQGFRASYGLSGVLVIACVLFSLARFRGVVSQP